ncbi:MAG: hypothetical protein ACRCW2_09995, partial [Cellulosilyticaceae bacterium]
MLHFVGNHPISPSMQEIIRQDLAWDWGKIHYEVRAEQISEGLQISFHQETVTLSYSTVSTYIRALALLKEVLDTGDVQTISQKPLFEQLGVMLDCSRNAV